MTCKSKERPDFNYGRIYIKGFRRIIHDINLALVNFGYKELTPPFQVLLCSIMELYDIVTRLKNMVRFIEVSKKIPRSYIRREIEAVHQSFYAFESAFLNAFSKERAADTVSQNVTTQPQQGGTGCVFSQPHKEKSARVLKSLAVNLASLRWGLYFLTLTYGSGFINQYGQLEIRSIKTKNNLKNTSKISCVQTSCTIS